MKLILLPVLLFALVLSAFGQQPSRPTIPASTLLRIVRAEDTRNWNSDLQTLFADQNPTVRSRAALAAGRIGDDQAVPALITLMQKDENDAVRSMAAFALGEVESPAAAEALIELLNRERRESGELRARAVEALGKIAAAVPKSEDARAIPMRERILEALKFEAGRRSAPNYSTILLGLTAILRAHPDKSGPVVARFLSYSDPHIRADAANTLARLKLKDGNAELLNLLKDDPDPIVRANAARVLGATEEKAGFAALLNRAVHDPDLRVRVSAIRALSALKDVHAAVPLLDRGQVLLNQTRNRRTKQTGLPSQVNELIEIAAAEGRLRQNSNDVTTIQWLKDLRSATGMIAPEVEIGIARVAPQTYRADAAEFLDFQRGVNRHVAVTFLSNSWRPWSNLAQGLAELADVKSGNPDNALNESLKRVLVCSNVKSQAEPRGEAGHSCPKIPLNAVPDLLRTYAAFKPPDIADVLAIYLNENDVVIRATAAELLGGLTPDERNTRLLMEALPSALRDIDLNDAALAVIEALAKQKNTPANNAIKAAFNSKDILVRQRAAALLKANGEGDFSSNIGSVQSSNTTIDYQRALARIGKQVRATVNTSKGSFVIELLQEEAPLTVDNFVKLARKNYFNGQSIPRVVPNFVIQTGDPRGDQNGGPGYSIRCEINQIPYTRGAVGMALAGKDTGGSQWFVTHSPQPHLDGGYTVFGRVVSGMEVVDNVVRGDLVRSIIISESSSRYPSRMKSQSARFQ